MISASGVSKTYGPVVALVDVDLDVPAGTRYGLVGPNGSGKTTLLEILAGLRSASSGRVQLDCPRERVAYCPDVAEFEPWLTAIEVLESALGLLGRRRTRSEIVDLLTRAGLGEVADRRVAGFSRGMTTRLNLAAALIGQPQLVLLDEPASALDPTGKVEVLELVASLAPTATVVLSSHDLSEVEAVCEHVAILDGGRTLYQGPLARLLAQAEESRWRIVVRPPATPVIAALKSMSWVSSISEITSGALELTASDRDRVETSLPGVLATTHARVVSFSPVRPSLKDVFLSLTSGPPDPAPAVDQPVAS